MKSLTIQRPENEYLRCLYLVSARLYYLWFVIIVSSEFINNLERDPCDSPKTIRVLWNCNLWFNFQTPIRTATKNNKINRLSAFRDATTSIFLRFSFTWTLGAIFFFWFLWILNKTTFSQLPMSITRIARSRFEATWQIISSYIRYLYRRLWRLFTNYKFTFSFVIVVVRNSPDITK